MKILRCLLFLSVAFIFFENSAYALKDKTSQIESEGLSPQRVALELIKCREKTPKRDNEQCCQKYKNKLPDTYLQCLEYADLQIESLYGLACPEIASGISPVETEKILKKLKGLYKQENYEEAYKLCEEAAGSNLDFKAQTSKSFKDETPENKNLGKACTQMLELLAFFEKKSEEEENFLYVWMHEIALQSYQLLGCASGNDDDDSNSGIPGDDDPCQGADCGDLPNPLAVVNTFQFPIRLAQGADGKIYASDARVGSVFIYNTSLQVEGELKGLSKPLGIAVDQIGNIYIGNDGRNNVEVYDSRGSILFTIDNGNIQMPNDLALAGDGTLYVVDSKEDTIKVYDSEGRFRFSFGDSGENNGQFRFPVAIEISYPQQGGPGEIYVADQGNAKVQVFDLQGNFLRAYGGRAGFSSNKGTFTKLQSLAFDGQGRLHAVDSYANQIQILDAGTGAYLDSYGVFGTDAGQLNLPLDIFINASGQVLVTNAGNRRVEIIFTVQPTN